MSEEAEKTTQKKSVGINIKIIKMKNLVVFVISLFIFNLSNAQITPAKDMGKAKPNDTKSEVNMNDPKVLEAHVVTVNGTTYTNLCVSANTPGDGCAALEKAWKANKLFTCSSGSYELIPYDSHSSFQCYLTGMIIQVRLVPLSVFRASNKTTNN